MMLLIVVFAIFHCAKGNMTVTPRNTVVLAGDRVELECRVDRNSTVFKWEVVRKSAVFETQTIAKSGVAINSSLGTDFDSNGSGVIYYNSTELEDAGNYSCSAHIGFDKKTIIYSAQLIVLGSLPICTSNYSGENDSSITMQCSVNFRGFWTPTMQWKQHDGDNSGNITDHDVKGVIESRTFPNSRVTSSLTVNRNSFGKGTYFSCRTYFERKSDGSLIMNATNIPDFVYVWVSTNYSNDPTTSKATMNGRRDHRHNYLRVALWTSVSVAVVLLVVVVAVAVGCHMRNRKIVRSLPEKQDNRFDNENCSASPAYYASDTMPELLTYDEIDELQISPVDYPPETTPRINKKPDDSATCIQEPDGSNSIEHNSDQVDTSPESMSKMQPTHDCIAAPVANGKGDILKPNPLYHTLDPIQSVLSPSIVESQISATL